MAPKEQETIALNAVSNNGKILAEFGDNYTPDFMAELAADVQKIREANTGKKFKIVKVVVDRYQRSKRMFRKGIFDYKI